MRIAWSSVVALGLVLGCTSSNSSSSDDAGGVGDAAHVDAAAVCDTFTKVGDPCSPAGPLVCFQECTTGGCTCKATASGGVWECHTDTSCEPDGSPLDDASEPDDGSSDDAASDAADDASDAGTDATSLDAAEAATDAPGE
jgi:hypothetical protein